MNKKHNSLNPLYNWRVNREDIQYLGTDLQRPECILTEPNGTVWTADARGEVVQLDHTGNDIAPPRLGVGEDITEHPKKLITHSL